MISPAVLLLVGVSPAAFVQGSDSIQLRFAPVLNGELHRLFQSRTVVTITSGGNGRGADSVSRSVRESAALGGMRQVVLQCGWVHPGERWTQELDIPVGVFAARPTSALDAMVLTSRVTFALDSLVPRARDTLAYISLEGRFRAKVQQLPGDRFRRSTGSLRGTLVWSTGWDTFVSQVTRIEVHVGVAASGVWGGRYIDEAALRTTVRAQVQASR